MNAELEPRFQPMARLIGQQAAASIPTIDQSGERRIGTETSPIDAAASFTEFAALQLEVVRTVEASERAVFGLVAALVGKSKRPYSATTLLDHGVLPGSKETAGFAKFFESTQNLISALALTFGSPVPQPQRSLIDKSRFEREDLKLRLARLTERQTEVFQLVSQGLPNKMIAFELGIAETTVKAHVGVVLRKLGMYNRARAIAVFGKIDVNFKSELPGPRPGGKASGDALFL